MFVEVPFHLFLGLGDETQAPPIPGNPGRRAERERPGVPYRVEQAQVAAQFFDAVLTPGEVVILLGR